MKPLPARAARGGKRGRRSSEAVDATASKFLAYVKANDGKRLEEISKGLKIPTKNLKLPAQKLLAAKAVRTTGQKRGTKYHVGGGAAKAAPGRSGECREEGVGRLHGRIPELRASAPESTSARGTSIPFVTQSLNRTAVDSAITRALQLFPRPPGPGHLTLDRDRWVAPLHHRQRVDLGRLASTLLGLAVKSARSLEAVQMLARHGLGADASVIGRSMVETYAAVLELTGASWAERLMRYEACTLKHQIAHIQDLKANRELDFGNCGLAPQFEAALAESQSQLKLAGLPDKESSWMPGGVQGALRRARLESLYDGLYRVGARASHGFDAYDHVEWLDDDRGFSIKARGPWIEPVIVTAPHVHVGALAKVSDALGLGVEAEALALQAELAGLLRSSMPAQPSSTREVRGDHADKLGRQIVSFLRRSPDQSLMQIARALSIDPETAESAIEKLARAGAVVRRDGREAPEYIVQRGPERSKGSGPNVGPHSEPARPPKGNRKKKA